MRTSAHQLLGRRALLGRSLTAVAAVGLSPLVLNACRSGTGSGAPPMSATGASLPRPGTPDEAIRRLGEGNGRFVAGNPIHPNQSTELRQQLSGSQQPYASILGCADSRTSPELVFDAGIGDLFVCRVAGNIATATETASLLYSQAVLDSELLLVLGHDDCGAVKAAIDVVTGKMPAGEFASLTNQIQPAVAAAMATGASGAALLHAAIAANVRRVVAALPAMSPGLAQAVQAGKLSIRGGVITVATGKVEMLG